MLNTEMSLTHKRDLVSQALALCVMTLALAGCGGGAAKPTAESVASSTTTAARGTPTSSNPASTSTATTPPTHTASTPTRAAKPPRSSNLAVEAGSICTRRSLELVAATVESVSLPAIAKVAEKRVAIERAGLRELEKLTPRRSRARDWGKFTADARHVVADLSRIAAAAARGEAARTNSVGGVYEQEKSSLRAVAKRAALGRCTEYG